MHCNICTHGIRCSFTISTPHTVSIIKSNNSTTPIKCCGVGGAYTFLQQIEYQIEEHSHTIEHSRMHGILQIRTFQPRTSSLAETDDFVLLLN